MLENGCHVTAVDNDPESREIIGRRTTSDAFSRLDFRQEDFKNLKLNKAKYDLWSKGPDKTNGKNGGDTTPGADESDDICSWKQR